RCGCCPRLPAAGVENRPAPADVCSVDFEMVRAPGVGRGDARIEVIVTGDRDGQSVLKPLPRIDPSDVVAAAPVSRRFDVQLVTAMDCAGIARAEIVIGDSFTPVVVIYGLNPAGNGPGGAAEGRLRGALNINVIEVPSASLDVHAHHLLTCAQGDVRRG